MKRKWNWVDTLVVVLIAAAVLLFLNRDRILGSGAGVASNKRSITFTVEAKELSREMVTELKVGDKIYSQYKLQNATITDVIIRPAVKSMEAPDGTLKLYEDENEIVVEATVEAEVFASGPYLDLGGQEIKVGLSFILKTVDVEVVSDIKHIEVKP